MRKLKQFLIFLLVVITIYSTLLFYLLMSVQADSRLQEIDYIEKTKHELSQRVIYMDKIVHLADRFHHFTFSLLRFRKARPSHCKTKMADRGILLISASSFDFVSIYGKVLREVETGVDECSMAEVFVLRRIRPLVLGSQQNINKYASEVGEAIKYLTIEAQLEISVLAHEEGAVLLLSYLARRTVSLLFTNIVQRIRAVVMVDLTHPFVRVMHDPPYRTINALKREIFENPERVQIFNKLKIVVVSTYKQDEHLTKFHFSFGEGPFVFANTTLISTRQMANIHYYLPPNSLAFPPFIRRLSQFLSKSALFNLDATDILDFFRHGQSHPYELIEQQRLQQCPAVTLQKGESRVIVQDACAVVAAVELEDEEVVAVYSQHHFQMFAGGTLQRIYPFDNLTEGSTFLLQQLANPAYIINPEGSEIFVQRQNIVNPIRPLPLPKEEVLQASQLIFTQNFVVRVCPGVLLLFPLHFAQGSAQRKQLGETGQGQCFPQDNIMQEFSWQFFLHWSLFRNIIIFTLLCTEYRRQHLSDRLIEQFLINLLLLLGREDIEGKLFYTLYMVSFGLLVEYVMRALLQLCSKLAIRRKWGNSLLLLVSAVCLVGSVLNLFNVWSLFLFALLLFINEENILIILIKLYFLKQEIWHSGLHFQGLSDIGLLTMWVYTSQPSNRVTSGAFWTVERLFSGLLVVGCVIGLDSSGSLMDSMVTIYMKVLIVVKMLRIIRK